MIRRRIVALLVAIVLVTVAAACKPRPLVPDEAAEMIPGSWVGAAQDVPPRVAVGPWFGWQLSLAGGLQRVGGTGSSRGEDAEAAVVGVYAAWLDSADENPHANPDRHDYSIADRRRFAIAYAEVRDRYGPLVLEFTRTSDALTDDDARSFTEGVTLEINISGDAGTFRHSARVLPSLPRELRTPDEWHVDWFLNPDDVRESRTVQWVTDEPIDLQAMAVRVPDPFAPNDPTRSLVMETAAR